MAFPMQGADLVESQYLVIQQVAKDAIQQLVRHWDVDAQFLVEDVEKWITEARDEMERQGEQR